MEKYREKIKLNAWINGAAVAALILVQVLAFTRVLRPVAADSHWGDMWNGFIAGAALGIMALFIVGLVMNIRALRNEKELRKLYVKENDERQQSIYTAARSAGTQVFLIGGLVAGIVAGYYSVSVSITIIACVFVNSMLCGAFKLYYNRKF